MDVLLLVLAILAIALTVGTMGFGVLFYQSQKRQGERISMSVMSTVDQIYRRITGPGMFEDPLDYGADVASVSVGFSQKFLRLNESVELIVDAAIWQSLTGVVEIEFVIERPSGRQDSVARTLSENNGSFDLRLLYPSESFEGSTSDPGRYHVAWKVADTYELETPSTGARERRSESLGSGSDSFYVLP